MSLAVPSLRSPVGRLAPRGRYSFSPTEVAGLTLWLQDGGFFKDAALADPVTADGDLVYTWADASGGANHLVQATDTKRPTYRTNVRATRPAVRFDATDDFMSKAFTLNQPTTGFIVCKFPVVNKLLFEGVGSGGKGSLGPFATGTCRLHAGTALTTPTGFTHNAWVVISWVLNGATSEIWRNGVSAVTGAAGASVMGGIFLGSNGTGISNFMGSDVGELLLYAGALSTTDRQAVENYLLAKWMAPKEPIELAGCNAWYRGDFSFFQDSALTVPATAEGAPVGGWASKVGTTHLTQPSASAPDRRPQLKLALLNGKNAVRFDGLDDWLQGGVALDTIFTGATGLVYVVFRPNAITQMGNEAANSYLADGVWCDTTARTVLSMTGTTPLLHAGNSETGAAVDFDYARQGITTGSWYVHRWRHVGGTLYSKRTGLAEVTVASGNWATAGFLRLGANFNGTFPASVDIAELFTLSIDPSPADEAALGLYLQQRYLVSP